MMIHISKKEAETILHAVQDSMTMCRKELEECYVDEEYSHYCEGFSRCYKLEQKIKGWLNEEKKL